MKQSTDSITTLAVSGMTCGSCRAHVTQALAGVPGVTDVNVDLGTGRATVTSQAGGLAGQLIEAVRAAGYEAEVTAATQQAAATVSETAGHCLP